MRLRGVKGEEFKAERVDDDDNCAFVCTFNVGREQEATV